MRFGCLAVQVHVAGILWMPLICAEMLLHYELFGSLVV